MLWPYSKKKPELESNLCEILPVNFKFFPCSTLNKSDKTQTRVPEVWLKVQKQKK